MPVSSAVPSESSDRRVAVLVEDRLRLALHEMRQPVSVALAVAEVTRSLPGVTDEISDHLDRIIEQVQEVAAAASSVLGSEDEWDVGPVDVEEVLDSVCRATALTWRGRLVRRGERRPVLAAGDRVLLRRCLVNVVDNAVRAAGPTGKVVVNLRHGADLIRIDVEDDGPGFGHVPSRTGLGLAVTRRALEALGGALSVGLPSGVGGARVALIVPAWPVEEIYAVRPVHAV